MATVFFAQPSDDQLRGLCRESIESLEHWLRRLIDEVLSPQFGDIFEAVDAKGNRLLRRSLAEDVNRRRTAEPGRYPRKIDAVVLSDAIDIICKPDLFPLFRGALRHAFPDGAAEARTFLTRIALPRNNLAHANSISHRQAEQVLCYSADVIDSLKCYYIEIGMHQEFNVPLVLRVTDSFGNAITRAKGFNSTVGYFLVDMRKINPNSVLRAGDMFSVEVEIDPGFDPSEYELSWAPSDGAVPGSRTRFRKLLTDKDVAENWSVTCTVVSNKEWHRMSSYDDRATLMYKVLPPV